MNDLPKSFDADRSREPEEERWCECFLCQGPEDAHGCYSVIGDCDENDGECDHDESLCRTTTDSFEIVNGFVLCEACRKITEKVLVTVTRAEQVEVEVPAGTFETMEAHELADRLYAEALDWDATEYGVEVEVA